MWSEKGDSDPGHLSLIGQENTLFSKRALSSGTAAVYPINDTGQSQMIRMARERKLFKSVSYLYFYSVITCFNARFHCCRPIHHGTAQARAMVLCTSVYQGIRNRG